MMESIPQWGITFDLPGMGRVTWVANGQNQMETLVSILLWNKVTKFEVKYVDND